MMLLPLYFTLLSPLLFKVKQVFVNRIVMQIKYLCIYTCSAVPVLVTDEDFIIETFLFKQLCFYILFSVYSGCGFSLYNNNNNNNKSNFYTG